MTIEIPSGFRFAAVHCGLKSVAGKEDLTLVHCPRGAVAAGVFTQNLVYAAPVAVDRERVPSADIRVVIVNSGNANACTGERGLDDARTMCRLAAEALGARQEQALVMSTGIIGRFLAMEKIASGVRAAASRMNEGEAAFHAASRGIMTTDKGPKVAGNAVACSGGAVRVAGMCKGAGMIGPRMATMLSVILTDARLTPADAHAALTSAADESFNCLSVEGHMSTNDTVLLLASGEATARPLAGADLAAFQTGLTETTINLARQIADDGEGATHLINIHVRGCATREDARRIAKTIAESALVKAGIAGADPNWGRVVSAVGYAGVPLDPSRIDLSINGHRVYQQGAPVPFEAAVVSRAMRDSRETFLDVSLAEGSASCRFWTSDLTVDYVRFNSDYST